MRSISTLVVLMLTLKILPNDAPLGPLKLNYSSSDVKLSSWTSYQETFQASGDDVYAL